MIEQGFSYVNSTIKEMIVFFETRVENLEPEEEKKNLQQLPRNPRKSNQARKRKEQTRTPVL